MSDWLEKFITESNRIEGILRPPLDTEGAAHGRLLVLEELTLSEVSLFVSSIQPGAVIRDKKGLDVRVGNFYPDAGGPAIPKLLDLILWDMNKGVNSPWELHLKYENLHPFTDGNGRSGRALWLWQMLRSKEDDRAKHLGFLHTFYYQTLKNSSAT